MNKLKDLKNCKTLQDIALWLGYKPKALSFILYKISDNEKYEQFTIDKKYGGERTISAPCPKLKNLQRKLATDLNICFEEIRKSKNHSKSLSHGFRKKHSIITNASSHKNKRYVFNIDLKDFFPSINFGRVRGFFVKNLDFELDPTVATIIAQISCHDNSLPQGSPCSPVISNFIGHILDIRMVNAARKACCTYTRYADDLTFSTNNKNFPESIANLSDPDSNIWLPSKSLVNKIEKLGFSINDNKTSMQYTTNRQMTTGLVVNKKVNIKNEYYKQARSMCHSLFKSDEYYLGRVFDPHLKISKENNMYQEQHSNKTIGTINKIEGILTHIYNVKTYNEKKTKLTKEEIQERKHHPNAITKLFREFLFYKYFFSLNKPLIITEGKTDIVYLKCALRSLHNDYQSLIEEDNKNFSFNVNFLKWSNNFIRTCSLAKGTSGQGHIIDLYEKTIQHFKGNGKTHPVIILVDNDSGSASIFSRIKQIQGSKTADRTKDFYCIKENLYVVATPLGKNNKDTLIEDFFEKKLLNKKLNKKNLNLDENTFDKTKHYSKSIFAEHIIGKNYKDIDFSNFKPILNRICSAINDHNNN